MRFKVLSSGSKGNTTYIEYKGTKILIDIGNTCKYVKEKLKEIGVEPQEIDGILITHTHSDHIKGLKVFVNKYKCKVYATKKIIEELDYITNYEIIPIANFSIKNIWIEVIKLSHDAPECVGYILHTENKKIVYITDTGYINEKYFVYLKNADAYILESNHDIEMLSNGRYPFQLRQRILGDKGHISNHDCARYLETWIGNNTKTIVLAHLSEENNTEELAYNTLIEKLKEKNKIPEKIIIAHQDKETEMIEI